MSMNFTKNVGKGTQGIPGTSILGHSQGLATFVSELVDLALKFTLLRVCVWATDPQRFFPAWIILFL